MNFGKNEGFMVLHFGLDMERMIYDHQLEKKRFLEKEISSKKLTIFSQILRFS